MNRPLELVAGLMDDIEETQRECIDPEISPEVWELRLYIAGQTLKSKIALANIKKFCEKYLAGRCKIEVIDLIKNPQIAKRDNIVTIPLLIREFPKPIRKLIGDFSNTERVRAGFDLCSPEEYKPT